MSDFESIIPRNPVEVTKPFAYELIFNKEFDRFAHSDKEVSTLYDINLALEQLGMKKDYWVETDLAFVLPEDTSPDEEGNVNFVRINDQTEFKGELLGGRSLKMGKVIGEQSVRSICLTFHETTILSTTTTGDAVIPINADLEEEHRMYVPVFAVRSIEQAAA